MKRVRSMRFIASSVNIFFAFIEKIEFMKAYSSFAAIKAKQESVKVRDSTFKKGLSPTRQTDSSQL